MINQENITVSKHAKIKEIFASIQGEGPYIGAKQLFIRFCTVIYAVYCDTDFEGEERVFASRAF